MEVPINLSLAPRLNYNLAFDVRTNSAMSVSILLKRIIITLMILSFHPNMSSPEKALARKSTGYPSKTMFDQLIVSS
jgi:hypothetical protein